VADDVGVRPGVGLAVTELQPHGMGGGIDGCVGVNDRIGGQGSVVGPPAERCQRAIDGVADPQRGRGLPDDQVTGCSPTHPLATMPPAAQLIRPRA
jgi:hypothetical protein